MATRYKDYAGMFPNYQQLGQTLGNIRNQQWQGGTQGFQNILQALTQMMQQNQLKQEQQLAQNQVNSALYDTEQVRSPQTNPSISPLMQSRGNQINDIAGFNAMGNSPTFQTRQTFNPTMEKLAPLLTNPRTAPLVKSLLEGSKAFQGTTRQESPFENTIKEDVFGRRTQLSNAQTKPDRTSQNNAVTVPTGKPPIQQGGYWMEEVIDSDPITRKPLAGAVPRLEPKTPVSQSTGGNSDFNAWRKSPDYQDVLKAVASGGSKFSTLTSGRFSTMAQKQQFLADIRKVNPDFKEYAYDNDKVFQQMYLPGKPIGNKIANLNTAIEHTGKLIDLTVKLGNNDAQFMNSVNNWFAQTLGTKRAEPLNSFEAVKSALAGELGSLFKGGNAAATDVEIDNISKIIESTQKPSALIDALKMYLSVGKDRIDQFSEPYNNRFGEDKDFFNVNPRKILQNYGIIQGTTKTIWD